MQGRVDGEFRIQKNPSDPGTAAIFANYPAPYSSAGLGLAEEVCVANGFRKISRTNLNFLVSRF